MLAKSFICVNKLSYEPTFSLHSLAGVYIAHSSAHLTVEIFFPILRGRFPSGTCVSDSR